MTTLESAQRPDAAEGILTADLVDVQLIFDEAMARLSIISQGWAQASRMTLDLKPRSSAGPISAAPNDLPSLAV